jgi:hypothetical protein
MRQAKACEQASQSVSMGLQPETWQSAKNNQTRIRTKAKHIGGYRMDALRTGPRGERRDHPRSDKPKLTMCLLLLKYTGRAA